MYDMYNSWGFQRVKSILKKGDRRLFSSFQKAWEITPFAYVVAESRNLRNTYFFVNTVCGPSKIRPAGYSVQLSAGAGGAAYTAVMTEDDLVKDTVIRTK